MKKHIIIAIIMAFASIAPMSVAASGASTTASEKQNSELMFSEFSFGGVSLLVPENMSVSMDSQHAIIKKADGKFGVSIEIEKDKNASSQGSYEVCQRLVTAMHIEGAMLSRVKVGGMEGAIMEGKLDGANVAVEVLNGGKKYIKVVAIYADEYADVAKTVLQSIRK